MKLRSWERREGSFRGKGLAGGDLFTLFQGGLLMFKAYLASLDVGTTGTRCALFNDQGQCLGLTYREYPLSYPSPGWVEQDLEALWRVTLEVAQEAFQKAQIAPHQVVALGITNQRETIVAWDIENDRPLYPAIVWQDRRTSPRCQQIKKLKKKD